MSKDTRGGGQGGSAKIQGRAAFLPLWLPLTVWDFVSLWYSFIVDSSPLAFPAGTATSLNMMDSDESKN